MSTRDLTVLAGEVKQRPDHRCLLTGQPCGLVSVTLRRMILLGDHWSGRRVLVLLPLETAPALAFWQYLRMLRPYVVLFGTFFFASVLGSLVEPKPGIPVAVARAFAFFAVAIGLWYGMGRVLDRFEFVRLLRYSERNGTVTLRFSTETLAEQAKEVLVSPLETSDSANGGSGGHPESH